MIRSFFCAAGFCAALLFSNAAQADRALLIGVDDYAAPEVPDLKGAKNDVAAVEKMLVERLGFGPGDISRLTDQDATKAGILREIETWLINGTQPGDRVFLYFSGHGTQTKDLDGDEPEDQLDEALAPHDYAGPSTLITDDVLNRLLARLRDRRVTVIIDACNSGTISRGIGGGPLGPGPQVRWIPPLGEDRNLTVTPVAGPGAAEDDGLITPPPAPARRGGLEVWSAAAPYQLAFEDRFDGVVRGVFTKALVDGVYKNPKQSRTALFGALKAASEQYCLRARHRCRANNRRLTPQLEADPRLRQEPLTNWSATTQTAARRPAEAVRRLLSTGARGAEVEVLPQTVQAGELFQLRVTAPNAGELLIFSVATDGVLTMLAPNPDPSVALRRKPQLQAGAPFLLPDPTQGVQWRAARQSGSVFAVIAEPGFELTRRARDAYRRAGGDPVKFAETLVAELDGVQRPKNITPVPAGPNSEADNRLLRWSMAHREYRFE